LHAVSENIKPHLARTQSLTEFQDKALSDEELMGRIARSDAQAFEILVQRHQGRILNLIYRTIGDRIHAEDVAQEVFLRVWLAAKDYSPKAKFTTWLYRIAVNLCLDNLKSAHRKQPFMHLYTGVDNPGENDGVLNGCDSAPSPEELLIDAEESHRIFAALQALPTNQRLAVVLTKFDGLSYNEISQALGCSVSAVESLLVRAKKNLCEKLLAHNS
jgi:RNA polymerase sigma-70 factor (ECF subfamily)